VKQRRRITRNNYVIFLVKRV